jgi:galactose oxidase
LKAIRFFLSPALVPDWRAKAGYRCREDFCQSPETTEGNMQSSVDALTAPAETAMPAQPTADDTTAASATSPDVQGEWSVVFSLPNVAIHTHVLRNGKVLFWGRRKHPTTNDFESLNEHETHAFLFDPATMCCRPTSNQPVRQSGESINLFCSSHTFLPDGRLMVTGGHLYDSQGIDSATIYDPENDTWEAAEPMQGQITTATPADSLWKNGRWYPTAVTLADGGVFVCSGTLATSEPETPPHAPGTRNNSTPEIWDDAPWKQLTPFIEATDLHAFLFPRFHLAPDGRVFMAGPGTDSFFFDTAGIGTWLQSSSRQAGPREYAPSVMYDVGKVVFIGGGNDPDTQLPSQLVEKIDLTSSAPAWQPAQSMRYGRRQHNATLLPDGTVLVTGGTQGARGAGGQGFNDLTPGMPVHIAELWDPKSDRWTLLAAEQIDRCYHSTAVLLPDGRVMSAGGGEYQPTDVLAPNDPADTRLDAQIFCPPYLFRGPRPEILDTPAEITYGQTFQVTTSGSVEIGNASLVGLSSVTHSFNTGQRINFLTMSVAENYVTLTAPPNANVCPPGFHLLFLLSKDGVPALGRMIRVTGQPEAPQRSCVPVVDQLERSQRIARHATRPKVVVGLTPVCPYGLATCWGGAYKALKMLDGVATVLPVANNREAVATLYLAHDGIPDLDAWPAQFARFANGSYGWRGVEMTLIGEITQVDGAYQLAANADRPAVALASLDRADKVQLDNTGGIPNSLPEQEATAYRRLVAEPAALISDTTFSVTGPIRQTASGFLLEVRHFKVTRKT